MHVAGSQFTPGRELAPLVTNVAEQEPTTREAAIKFILRSELPHITDYTGYHAIQQETAEDIFEKVADKFEAGQSLAALLLEYELATQSQPVALHAEKPPLDAVAMPKRPPVISSQPDPYGVPVLTAMPDTMSVSA